MFPSTIKEGRCRAIFVSVTITFILATIFVAARLITRLYIIKNRGWDNYCILLAWVSEPSSRCSTLRVESSEQRLRYLFI